MGFKNKMGKFFSPDQVSDVGLSLCSRINIRKNDNYLFVITGFKRTVILWPWFPEKPQGLLSAILRLKFNDLIFHS